MSDQDHPIPLDDWRRLYAAVAMHAILTTVFRHSVPMPDDDAAIAAFKIADAMVAQEKKQ